MFYKTDEFINYISTPYNPCSINMRTRDLFRAEDTHRLDTMYKQSSQSVPTHCDNLLCGSCKIKAISQGRPETNYPYKGSHFPPPFVHKSVDLLYVPGKTTPFSIRVRLIDIMMEYTKKSDDCMRTNEFGRKKCKICGVEGFHSPKCKYSPTKFQDLTYYLNKNLVLRMN